jgi:hypothetical protein
MHDSTASIHNAVLGQTYEQDCSFMYACIHILDARSSTSDVSSEDAQRPLIFQCLDVRCASTPIYKTTLTMSPDDSNHEHRKGIENVLSVGSVLLF